MYKIKELYSCNQIGMRNYFSSIVGSLGLHGARSLNCAEDGEPEQGEEQVGFTSSFICTLCRQDTIQTLLFFGGDRGAVHAKEE